MRVGPLGPFFMGRFSERGVLPDACSFSDCIADKSLRLLGVVPFRRLPRSDASDSVYGVVKYILKGFKPNKILIYWIKIKSR